MTDLDEFRLIRPLGSGGMGKVYLAHDTLLDRQVAIKVIGASHADAGSRDRFLTEARAVARLSHPNVISIYRVGTTSDGQPYLVQELLGGESLDRVARPLPWRRAAELVLGIARGVAAAHAHGILHRDIKPANVMLDDRGQVRILDFGLAKLSGATTARAPEISRAPRPVGAIDLDATRDPESDVSSPESQVLMPVGTPNLGGATAHGALLGTPRYLAPELWRGEPATVRSDLFAVGVVLYELVTGDVPVTTNDIVELERRVTSEPARPVVELVPELPAWFGGLIDRCLALDPADRWESAAELAHAIELGLTDGPPIPPGNPYRGLASFDHEHRAVFFGRGVDVTAVVDRLRHATMVTIAGDSGIGKSSLCHAGVVPAVRAGALDDRVWRIVSLVPGRRPFAALRDAMSFPLDADVDAVGAFRPPVGEALLVVVDQLEELVTIADRAEADRATACLANLADGVANVRVLLVVRGDFLTRVAALSALAGPFTRGLHVLRALGDADLREAVEAPARLKGVKFESPELVDELVASVGDHPGALPLLQFALSELWAARDPSLHIITASSLSEMGGVGGALARHADSVVLALGAIERDAARRILVRLVSPASTRIARPVGELVDGPAAASALEALVRGRLVVARDTTDGPTCELAHDALSSTWPTLRGWLDDRAGHRAVSERVSAAAAQWRREGDRRDLLWSRRQVQAARNVPDLGEDARAFLAACARQHRRARWLRVSLAAAVPAIVLATWLLIRSRERAARDHEVEERRARALALRSDGDTAASRALDERRAAFSAFDAAREEDGEAAWTKARTAAAAARAVYRTAAAELEMALARDPGSERVRRDMASLLWAHAILAESEHDKEAVADLVHRLGAYDPDLARGWTAPTQLDVASAVAVEITVAPILDRAGHYEVAAPAGAGRSHLSMTLNPGSYMVEFAAPDGLVVRAPVLVKRGQRSSLEVVPPRNADVPPGYVYIPSGEFLAGADGDELTRRDFLSAAPLHLSRTDAFLIGRHEVTFDEWITFLDALPAPEQELRRPRTRGGAVMVGELTRVDGGWAIRMQPGSVPLFAGPRQQLHYPDRSLRSEVRWERLPVSGIDLDDARAYAGWLDTTRRVPGARLCREREWERAARGADDRPFPHGTRVDRDDANLDITYERKSYGPDEVGSHPTSNSPFGVSDMLGNVWEWVEGENGPLTRGGGWYYGSSSALIANRDSADPAMRELTTGLRICAAAPPAR